MTNYPLIINKFAAYLESKYGCKFTVTNEIQRCTVVESNYFHRAEIQLEGIYVKGFNWTYTEGDNIEAERLNADRYHEFVKNDVLSVNWLVLDTKISEVMHQLRIQRLHKDFEQYIFTSL
mgnify:FL=1